MLSLLIIVLVGASIPAAIAYTVVKLTEREHGKPIIKSFRGFFLGFLKFVAALCIGVVVVMSWALGAFNGTNVAFQSSDGEWADSEMLFKGRNFNGILFRFELYRMRCAPNAVLQRTTSRPSWYQYESLFNDYSESKWKTPYAATQHKTSRGYYPPLSIEHCANKGATEQEMRVANEQAKQYIIKIMH